MDDREGYEEPRTVRVVCTLDRPNETKHDRDGEFLNETRIAARLSNAGPSSSSSSSTNASRSLPDHGSTSRTSVRQFQKPNTQELNPKVLFFAREPPPPPPNPRVSQRFPRCFFLSLVIWKRKAKSKRFDPLVAERVSTSRASRFRQSPRGRSRGESVLRSCETQRECDRSIVGSLQRTYINHSQNPTDLSKVTLDCADARREIGRRTVPTPNDSERIAFRSLLGIYGTFQVSDWVTIESSNDSRGLWLSRTRSIVQSLETRLDHSRNQRNHRGLWLGVGSHACCGLSSRSLQRSRCCAEFRSPLFPCCRMRAYLRLTALFFHHGDATRRDATRLATNARDHP